MKQTIIAAGSLEPQIRDEVVDMIERFMLASMEGDRDTVRRFMSPDVEVTFTGGRKFPRPEQVAEFNGRRYGWVKKAIERYDLALGEDGIVIYCTGTLYGAWPDGEPFEGNRYVDRFVVRDGKIVKMDVWNDSAELLLIQAGLATA